MGERADLIARLQALVKLDHRDLNIAVAAAGSSTWMIVRAT